MLLSSRQTGTDWTKAIALSSICSTILTSMARSQRSMLPLKERTMSRRYLVNECSCICSILQFGADNVLATQTLCYGFAHRWGDVSHS